MTQLTGYAGSDNVLEIESLTDAVSGSAITDATVQATLTDLSGNEVSGQSWPLAMPHDTGGTYRGILADDIAIQVKRTYKATVVADSPTYGKKTWVEKIVFENAGAP